tara:strand:- start:54 stop:272 length:219 start_codon:yes stop_codon:yes gene_type:complete
MKKLILIASLACTTSNIAIAYDTSNEPKCVIDQCDEDTCTVETPEGWVSIPKKSDYKEGKKIVCPTWLVEPT